MKNSILISLIWVGTMSCNGNYDASPDKNYSNVPSPIGPKGVTLGNIKARINGTDMSFGPSDYFDVDHPQKNRRVSGYTDFSTANQKFIAIDIAGYDGVKDYTFDATASSGGITYTIVDATNNNEVKAVYKNNTQTPGKGRAKIGVGYDEENILKGLFSGVLYKYDKNNTLDLKDSIVITEGRFSVPKK